MQIPTDFKTGIENAFYDKTITIIGESIVTEADGANKKNPNGEAIGTFTGNARLMNFKQVQKEYGLDYQIDIVVTCGVETSVVVGNIVEYNGVKYDVTDVLPFDSHKMIVGVKCHQQ